ncbi:hypothetical protein [uncultured Selenomonas sp.]|nr:hypothetical protein [uncultured Selenomonas sp.]
MKMDAGADLAAAAVHHRKPGYPAFPGEAAVSLDYTGRTAL